MKWIDIKKSFKDRWVLIEVAKVDEGFNVLEGEVLAHSKDKDEVYRKLLQIRPKEFSIEYTGELPEDLAIVTLPFGSYLDGLLGMDFLNKFDVEIKIASGEILVK